MKMFVRILLGVGGLLMIGLSIGYFFGIPWLIESWLWKDKPLSLAFVASMQAAIGAAMLWISISGELAALAIGAINLLVMMSGSAYFLFTLSRQEEYGYLITYAMACLGMAIFSLLLFIGSFGIPLRDRRPLPVMVRLSFIIFSAALISVGVALLMHIPNIFPWELTIIDANRPGWSNPHDHTIFGWMFIGDAFYFLYALIFPRWHNAKAQLWSFLAYDIVLLSAFVIYFARVVNLTSYIVYTAVLIYSALVAIYYLLINRSTRTNSA